MSNYFTPSYEQKRGPEPIGLEQYIQELAHQWQALLNSNPSESQLQKFLELNPCLVPGAWTPGCKSGHYPLHCALITQPELSGLSSRKPDFMWIAVHSLAWYPTLIEIEKPSKKIFRKDNVPTSQFSQALNQIAQWRTWFSDPSNQALFAREYGVSNWALASSMQMKPHFILVYGRRNEFIDDPERKKHRASLIPASDIGLMSFDRLKPDKELEEAITVRAIGNGKYRLVSVPPNFTLTPSMADRLLHISDFDKVINSNSKISTKRKPFLLERITYWRGWASSKDKGVIAGYYRE